MKKLIMLLLMVTTMTIQAQNQVALNWGFGELSQINSSRMDREVPLGTYSITDSEKKQILEGQYLNKNYSSAKVDAYETPALLRFNLFNNQMEFSKDGNIYYIKKDVGRTVHFKDTNSLYKVYDVFGSLEYLKVKANGKNSLLVKESSKFIRPRKNSSTYGGFKKPEFKRNKDDYFIELSNGELLKVPYNKKAFLKLFEGNEKEIKTFMKERKLSHKKESDLRRIVAFLNSK